MKTRGFVISALLSACATVGNAADYLLKFDAFGYHNVAEEEPKEQLLHSIEVVARPGQPFHSKVTLGAETVILAGTMRPGDKGLFAFQIRYAHSVDTGETIPTPGGGSEPRLCGTSMETTVSAKLGESALLGGTSTETRTPQGDQFITTKSKFRATLVANKYELPAED